jgi:hypothetical protein
VSKISWRINVAIQQSDIEAVPTILPAASRSAPFSSATGTTSEFAAGSQTQAQRTVLRALVGQVTSA